MKGIKYVALFFAIALAVSFFGSTYGAEPKRAQCDIGSYALRERVSGTPILETLRHVRAVAVNVYGEEARNDDSIAWQLAKNTVNVAYDFDLASAKKNLNPAMAFACDKFVSAVEHVQK